MKLKRLIAGVLSAAMMFSVGSALAFAVDGTDTSSTTLTGNSLTFASTINLGYKAVSAPNATFTYKLETAEATSYNAWMTVTSDTEDDIDTEETFNVFAGIAQNEDATTDWEQDVEFTVSDYADANAQVSKDITFSFADVTFTEAGYYHYTITRSSDDIDNSITDGLTSLDKDVCDLYVTVEYDENDGTTLKVTNIIMVDDDGTKSTGYNYTYGLINSDANSESDTTNFIITDSALGEMANSTKDFLFTVSMTGVAVGTVFQVTNADNDTEYIIVTDNAGGVQFATQTVTAGVTSYATNGTDFTFYLKDGEEYYIHAIIPGTTFTVTISDPSDPTQGYSLYSRGYGLTDALFTTSATATSSKSDTDVDAWLAENGFTEGDAADYPDNIEYKANSEDKYISTTFTMNDGSTYTDSAIAVIDIYNVVDVTFAGVTGDADYFFVTDELNNTNCYVIMGSDLADWLVAVGTLKEDEYNGITDLNFTLPDGLAVQISGNPLQNLLDYMSFGYTIEGYDYSVLDADGSLHYEHYWNLASTYTVTYTGACIVQIGDTLDSWNQLVADIGIDFATVKGVEETDPDNLDDYGITYSAALPDTGVVLDLAPYAIMMLLAAGAISLRFVRVARKTEE